MPENKLTAVQNAVNQIIKGKFCNLLLADILLFLAFRSYLFIVVGIILTVSVPLSFCMAWHLTRYLEGKIVLELPPEKKILRQGELMVKERVSLSGSEHVLLMELFPEKKKADAQSPWTGIWQYGCSSGTTTSLPLKATPVPVRMIWKPHSARYFTHV